MKGGNKMKDISTEVLEAIEVLKRNDGFNCLNLSARAGISINDEAIEALKENGFRICWADTFKGGCWIVSK